MSRIVSAERGMANAVVFRLSGGLSLRAQFFNSVEAREVADALSELLDESERLKDEAQRTRELVKRLATAMGVEVTP